jgi:hypothetical protein
MQTLSSNPCGREHAFNISSPLDCRSHCQKQNENTHMMHSAKYPPTSPERRACETTSHQPAAASQPSQPASQDSQRCIWASKPQASRHRWLQTLNIGASNRFPQGATGCHSPPQVATGCQTFWHPQHLGGSQTCHKPIKYRRYGQLPSKSCGGGLSAA